MSREKITLHIVLMLVKSAPTMKDIDKKTDEEIKNVASLIGYPNLDIKMMRKVYADLSKYSDDTLVDIFFTMNNIVSLLKEP